MMENYWLSESARLQAEVDKLKSRTELLREVLEKFCDSYEPHLRPERCQYCSEAYWAAREVLEETNIT
jgi:hypothetical protein